jgi:hypothetical protein
VRKSVEKVMGSIEPNQVPTTEELITKYIATCGPKIEKLVKVKISHFRFNASNHIPHYLLTSIQSQAYVDRHNIACHPTFKYSST